MQKFSSIYCLIVIVATVWTHDLRAQEDNKQVSVIDHEPGLVGFQLLEELDYSRSVTGGTSSSTVHPRPIRIYLWYPARNSDAAQPMRFGHYAALADEDIWPAEIARNLRQELKYSRRVLARSLGPERFNAQLQEPVLALENAEALEGPYPLIVIGQGLYYEFPVAFAALGEYLASRGFVVATCPLVGTNSPFVRMDIQDLETFVRDLEFVIAQARRFSFDSQDKLGVFGFDMGGMAGLILAMRNADVDAFVSVSSGILNENPSEHPSYIPAAAPDYDPLTLHAPWLHSVPATWWTRGSDSLAGSLFDIAIHSERYLLLTEGMGHVDYTSYALIEDRSAMSGYWATARPEADELYKAVSRYIYNFFTAFLAQDPESLTFLSQDPDESNPASTMTLEHRRAVPVSITYEEFVQAVIAGKAEEAIDEVRALRETQPDHILLNETYLERLVWSLRSTWGLNEEAMPVIRFRAELYPSSVGAQQMLAQGHTAVGNYTEAIEVYSRLLETNPDDSYSRSQLSWLRSQ